MIAAQGLFERVASAAMVCLLLIMWRRSKERRRRWKLGLCAACGYDIRSCNQRCAECGALIPDDGRESES